MKKPVPSTGKILSHAPAHQPRHPGTCYELKQALKQQLHAAAHMLLIVYTYWYA